MELPVSRETAGARGGLLRGGGRRGALLLVLAFAGVALGWWIGTFDGGPPDAFAPGEGRPAPFTWRTGETREYGVAVSYDVALRAPPATSAQRSYARLAGRLRLTVAQAHDDGRAAQVDLRLAGLTYQRDGQSDGLAAAAMSLPFAARVDATGTFDDFRFAPGVAAQERSDLTDWMRLFQQVIPAGAGGAWQSVERHAMGRFEAVYGRDADGTVRKRKVRYLETTSALRSLGEVTIVRSDVRAHLASSSTWVDDVAVDEELLAGPAADPRLHVVVRARLEAVGAGSGGAAPSGGVGAAEPPSTARADARPPTAATDFAGVTGRLRQPGAGRPEFRDLTLLLGRSPELAADAAGLLREEVLPEASASCIVDALAAVASPSTQAALVRTVLSGDVPATRRRRAVIALGGVERPTDEVLQGMWNLWSGGADSPAADLGPPAALALGRLANRLRTNDPARHVAVRDRLLAELRAERDPVRASVLLKALGNDRDPTITASIGPYLSAEAPLVRASAADTLGLVGGEDASLALTARLDEEPADWVRQKVAEGILAIAQTPPAALRAVLRRLATEEHAGTRLALARIAARGVAADPDARAALELLLAKESDEAIRDVAARALAPAPGPSSR